MIAIAGSGSGNDGDYTVVSTTDVRITFGAGVFAADELNSTATVTGGVPCDNGHFLIIRATVGGAGILYECSTLVGLECGLVDLFRKLDSMDMWIRANDKWQLLSSTSAEDDMNNINPLPTLLKGINGDTIEAALGIFRFFSQSGSDEDLTLTLATSGEILFNTGSNNDLYRFNGDVEFLGGDMLLGTNSRDGVLELFDEDSGGDVRLFIRAAQSTSSTGWTFEFPPDVGTDGEFLQTDGGGVSIWSTIDIGDDTNLAAGRSLTLTGDSVAADAELFTRTYEIVIPTIGTTDDFLFAKAAQAITITDIFCIIDPADSGDSASINILECDSTGDSCLTVDAAITCDNDGAEDDGSLSNGTIDSGDWIQILSGACTGTCDYTTITVVYTVDD